MRLCAMPLAVLLALAGCSHGLPSAGEGPAGGTLRARLVAGEEAVAGAVVSATRSPGTAFEEESRETTADEEGTALLVLPPGSWYLTARSADGLVYGYYGPNPVQVAAGRETPAAIRGGPGNRPPRALPAEGGVTGIEGAVLGEEGPLADASVAFYLDASTQFRGPAYAEVTADREGRFAATLSPGRYFIVVRKRSSGAGPYGPLALGDHFGYYASNPVMLGENERLLVAVGAVRVQRRTGWSAASVTRLLLSGVIRDDAGRPLEGYRAFLHEDPAMLGKPSFVSEDSAADGRYEIWVDREGSFFLGARQRIGRARELGEDVGRYGGSQDGSVTITLGGGSMDGYDIVMEGDGGD
jgi:hypothetical protein